MDPLETKDLSDKTILRISVSKRLTLLIAVFTSFFALLAACSGLMGNRCSTRGLVAKNEAIYYQGIATNEWAYFQSRNIRKEINEIASKKENLDRFSSEADISFAKAKSYEAEREKWNELSKLYLEVSKSFGAALAFLQVAIILVPLTLIAETAIVFAFGSILGFVGLGFLSVAFYEYLKVIS